MESSNNICKHCVDVFLKFNRKVQQISTDSKIIIPKAGYYYYGMVDCWKCGKEIMVFTWGEWEDKGKPLEVPIPSSIKLEYSKCRSQLNLT
jgi:hypothetical protein